VAYVTSTTEDIYASGAQLANINTSIPNAVANTQKLTVVTQTLGARQTSHPQNNSPENKFPFTKHHSELHVSLIPSPINPEILHNFLEGYDPIKRQHLVNGFLYDFHLGFEDPRVS